MNKVYLCLLFVVAPSLTLIAHAKQNSIEHPGCAQQTAQQCVDLALQAMGGRERLQQIRNVKVDVIQHTLLMEQSYRQDPFITSYARNLTTIDLANQRILSQVHSVWPEADPHQAESDITLIVGANGGVYHTKDGDSPCSLSAIDSARQVLALGPLRLLLTAADAQDLHFEASEKLRSTPHTIVAFSWQKVPVRIFINSFNHLPDAIETTQQFDDFWYFWGDVHQRIYFDNWELFKGIHYPTNEVEERNGDIWKSSQALYVEFNVPLEEKDFAMDPQAVAKSAASPGWNRPFSASKDTQLAPGIDLFSGAWNSTIVKQPDGIVILEAPISSRYTQGVIDEAERRYPGTPIKAVLSTSDSWPHTGGVRYAVSQNLPIYILDLNQPLLDRMMAAPHTIAPDALQNASKKTSRWKIVSGKIEIGSGENRLELYPLRGASTERQYMVYFPERHLLYGSDTLVLNSDNTLYDPELMYEVVQAVKRENLQVETVFAMHQDPTPWNQVTALVEKAQQP